MHLSFLRASPVSLLSALIGGFVWLLCSTPLVGLAAPAAQAGPCEGEGTLEETAKCFHLQADLEGKYRLLAKDGQAEMDPATWQKGPLPEGSMSYDGTLSGSACEAVAVTVLGEAEHAGRALGRVELKQRCARERDDSRCIMTTTQTWVKEEGLWRRYLLPMTAREAGTHWNEGRYQQVVTAADAWLTRDPYAMTALRLKGWVMMRGVTEASEDEMSAHVNRMRALHPADSQTHLIAASLAPDFETARAALEALGPEDCMKFIMLQNAVLRAPDARLGLSLLDRHDPSSERAIMMRLTFNVELGQEEAARKILGSSAMDKWRATLTDEDPGYTIWWSVHVAKLAMDLGEHERAVVWLELALSRDPGHKEAKALIKLARKGKPRR